MKRNMDFNDSLFGSRARGSRLTLLRNMAGLSRDACSKKHGISASTIQSWEAAKAGGLTQRGAERMLEIFRKEGLNCTLEWLLYGIGNPPQLFTPLQFSHPPKLSENLFIDDQKIIQELLFFRQLHESVLDVKIEDDGMSPYFRLGDFVAGICHPVESLPDLHGLDCIVRTHENYILARKIKYCGKQNHCDLICVNSSANLSTPVLYQQNITQVAPIIWHRRSPNYVTQNKNTN